MWYWQWSKQFRASHSSQGTEYTKGSSADSNCEETAEETEVPTQCNSNPEEEDLKECKTDENREWEEKDVQTLNEDGSAVCGGNRRIQQQEFLIMF